MSNSPISGCSGCETSAGRMGCPIHGSAVVQVLGPRNALPTAHSQIESLQRLLASANKRIAALEQERDALVEALLFHESIGFENGDRKPDTWLSPKTWIEHVLKHPIQRSEDVQKLVEAARAAQEYLSQQIMESTDVSFTLSEELTEALKPFEKEKRK